MADPSLKIAYIVAPPRMAYYLEYSTRIYQVYLKYIAPEDIHTYSIEEVFMDVTDYLKSYEMTARELAMTIIRDVLRTTGITATAGIGTNLYLCKIAMDIVTMPGDMSPVRWNGSSRSSVLWMDVRGTENRRIQASKNPVLKKLQR